MFVANSCGLLGDGTRRGIWSQKEGGIVLRAWKNDNFIKQFTEEIEMNFKQDTFFFFFFCLSDCQKFKRSKTCDVRIWEKGFLKF